MQSPEQPCEMVHAARVATTLWREGGVGAKAGSTPHVPEEISPSPDADVSMASSGVRPNGSDAFGVCPQVSPGSADVSPGGAASATTRSPKQRSESNGAESSPQASWMARCASLSMESSGRTSKSPFARAPCPEPSDLLSLESTLSVGRPGITRGGHSSSGDIPLCGTPEGSLTPPEGSLTPPQGSVTPSDLRGTARSISASERPPAVPAGLSPATSPRSARWARRAIRAQRSQVPGVLVPGVLVPGASSLQGRQVHLSSSSTPSSSASPSSGPQLAPPGAGAATLSEPFDRLGHSSQRGDMRHVSPLPGGLGALSVGSGAESCRPQREAGATKCPDEDGCAQGSPYPMPVMRVSLHSDSALPLLPHPTGQRRCQGGGGTGMDRSLSCERRAPDQDSLVLSILTGQGRAGQVPADGSLRGGQHSASLAAAKGGSSATNQWDHLTRTESASPPQGLQGQGIQGIQGILLEPKTTSGMRAGSAVGGAREGDEDGGDGLGGAVGGKPGDDSGAKTGYVGPSGAVETGNTSPRTMEREVWGGEIRAMLPKDWALSPPASPKRSPPDSVVENTLDRLDERYGSPLRGHNPPFSNGPSCPAPSIPVTRHNDGRESAPVHFVTGRGARRSIAPRGSITPFGVSLARVGEARAAEGPSLEKALAAAEDMKFVRRLQKGWDRPELAQLMVKTQPTGQGVASMVPPASSASNNVPGTAVSAPGPAVNAQGTAVGAPDTAGNALQDAKGGSEPIERRRPKQGDMLRRYVLSRHEGRRRILELQSITPDSASDTLGPSEAQGAPQPLSIGEHRGGKDFSSPPRVPSGTDPVLPEHSVRDHADGTESGDQRTRAVSVTLPGTKDGQKDRGSGDESRVGGTSAGSGTGGGGGGRADVNRAAMSVLAPRGVERLLETSSSELGQDSAWAQRQREAMRALKPHQLCILNKPYKDVREFYAIHNQKLASGRYGVIRRCKDVKTGRIYACKTIHKKKVLGAEEADGIRIEVAALTMLKGHPAVIGFKGAFEDHQGVHLVMELCTGGDLFERIKSKKRLAERDAARLMASLVNALVDCHSRGIIHRDIKPENVLLTSTEVDYDIKLVDFGVAALFQPGKSLHGIAGTPEYMAPEVLKRRYGPQVDIWSAGVLLYVALSGLQPFWAASKQGLMSSVLQDEPSFRSPRWESVSEEAVDLVKRMLDKDPRTRITAEEILRHPWLQRHAKERTLSD